MKADYLRHIYECLSGDNSLLGDSKFDEFNFKDDVDKRNTDTLESNDQMEFVESEIYYSIYPADGQKESFKNAKDKLENFYSKKMSLLEFLEHEVVFEYEKVKDQLFDNDRRPKKLTQKKDILDHELAEFHPVFLSALLNQTVFLGDVQDQRYKEDTHKAIDAANRKKNGQDSAESKIESKQRKKESEQYLSDAAIYSRKKENFSKLYQYVLRWTDEIDNFSYIMTMSNRENQETSRSIQNLLERAMESWKDPK